ncbi:uncharacterized protein N7503_003244 [Penicillium pulvis]|uniref:uncharacterized protein n=1 Tax=Penicillium pulvis TaxID=1562058 RepID=UPI0025495DBB|nr:uncharacterized protein N7503_003244 [Penicillium pulvis]KAJ5805642.1 hypothetical protein N7503_003244 [Penicillium pulvis]
MPPDRPRIILEKSSTVRRRYQRSDKRFRFTAEQLKRIEREEQREKKAKELREKDKKRIANKKKKADADAKAREEARRQGLPDPTAGKIPASQPLLSTFLFGAKRPSPSEEPIKGPTPEPSPQSSPESTHEPTPEPTPEPTSEPPLEPPHEPPHELSHESPQEDAPEHESQPVIAESEPRNDYGNTEADSQAGDTEPDSDCFDDLDEELEQELSILEGAATPRDPNTHNMGLEKNKETLDTIDDDDEFSDCSAFDDEDILREAEAAAATQASHRVIKSPSITSALLQPISNEPPQNTVGTITSLSDSFRDDTADYLEDIFSRGCGDSFGELMQLGSKPRQAPI